jgi:hypothetical protein
MGRRINNSSGGSGAAPAPRVITGEAVETTLTAGQVVQLTGTAPYNVLLPSPANFQKIEVFYWNNTTGTITLSTPTGVFSGGGGRGTTTISIESGLTLAVQSDGTNWYTVWENLPLKSGTAGAVLTSDDTAGGIYWGSATINIPPTNLGNWNKATNPFSVTLTSGYASSVAGATLTFSVTGGGSLPLGLSLSSAGVITGNLNAATTTTVTLPITISDGNAIKKVNYIINISLTNSIPVWTTAAGALPQASSYQYQSLTAASLVATVGTGSITFSLASGSIGTGMSLNASTGVISGTNSAGVGTQSLSFSITASANGYSVTRAFTLSLVTSPRPTGQALYQGYASNTNGGCNNYTWTAPPGVCEVAVVAIGAGGGGYYGWAVCGGGGGGLAWANGIPVTPGASYAVVAGDGGCWSQSGGGCSCFPGVWASGGKCGCCSGCCVVTTTNTGSGGSYGMVAWNNTAGGGGGGGGYGPNQGWSNNSGHTGCYGGGGAGNHHHSSTHGTGGGGGTGIYGQGNNGACGNPGYSHQTGSGGQFGSNGTCGRPGEPWSNPYGNGWACGGDYGGGGGGGGTHTGGGWGGKGGVRIIWGPGRAWPSTNTGDM